MSRTTFIARPVKRDGHLALQAQRISPGLEWTPNQPGWCFLNVSEGVGYLWLGSQLLDLHPGSVIITPSGPACRLRASQLGELKLHFFRVLPEMVPGVVSPAERQQLESLAKAAQPQPRLYAPDHAISRQFAALLGSAAVGDTLLTRCQMLQLLGQVLTETAPLPAPRESRVVTARDRFERVVMRMPEAELRHESPATLAKLCGCSVRHFSRLFRAHFGHSFVPKKTELKLNKARQLLLETDAKVIDVAMDSGFQHVGMFTALFKKQFGMTPSRYRQRQRASKAG